MSMWTFDDSLETKRVERLNLSPDFDSIIVEINRTMNILCCHPKVEAHDYKGFYRAQFCIQISDRLFDIFFNSRTGYRAQYFRDRLEGLRANLRAIDCLAPRLLAYPDIQDHNFASDSLRSGSAKIWLVESGNEICCQCKGEWSPINQNPVHIRNGRWEEIDSDGRTAPEGTKLRVMGGFLNDMRDEWISKRKRHRSLEIHEKGWS